MKQKYETFQCVSASNITYKKKKIRKQSMFLAIGIYFHVNNNNNNNNNNNDNKSAILGTSHIIRKVLQAET
jgi:hypothetical protein